MHTWFSADYHLGHDNIRKYANRPFKTLEEMNTHLILNHNSRIKMDDTVYFLGDFCFRNSPGGKKGEGTGHRAEYYKKQLNGNIVFIKGNHDRNNSLKTCLEKAIIRFGGQQICLIHNPAHVDYRYALHFCGHVHGAWKFKRFYKEDKFTDMINVGCDVWNYRPVLFEEINKEYSQWMKTLNIRRLENQKNQTTQNSLKENERKN